MAVDLATLAIRVDALEVAAAEKKLDALSASGARAEKSTDGVTSAFKALAATLGMVKLAEAARDAAMAYARYETLGVAMRVVGNNAGYTGAQMDAYEKKLRSTGIAMTESRETLTKMAASHIDLAKATDLARIAQDAAVVGNINSSEAFNRMINGIRSAEVEVLRGIGLNVNFESSYAKLAAQLGKNAKDLTETEKTQARVNAVMGAGVGIAGTYEGAMGTAGKMINSMKRYLDDLEVSLGKAFGPAMTLLVNQMTASLKDANTEVNNGQSTVDAWGIKFRSVVISIEAELIRLSMLIDKVGGTMTAVLTGAGELIDVARNIKGAVSDMYNSVDTGWTESELTKIGKQWNKVYEDRYNAGDKALQGLADLEMKLTTEVKSGTDANEQARIKAGVSARAKQEAEYKAAAAAKDAASAAKKAHSEAEKAANAHATELQHLLDKYLPLRGAAETVSEAEKGLAELRQQGAISAEDYALALQHLREEHSAEIEAATHALELQTQLADAYREVTQALMTDQQRKVYAIEDANSKLMAQVDLLEQEHKITGQLAATWRAQLGERMAQDIQAVNEEASQSSKLFEDMAKNIQSAFSGMFESLLDGTGNMLDDLGTLFKKLLAQMATMAIAQPIIIPVVTAMGGAMGVSQNTIAKSLGVDVSSLSGVGGLGSMFSSGSLQSMGVSALSGLGSGLQYLGLNGLGNTFMAGGEWLNGLAGGMGDALTAGAGSLLMSALSGKLNTSSLFQAGGAALGSMLGPVGSVAGGLLGSIVGGLFGDSPPQFEFDPTLNTSKYALSDYAAYLHTGAASGSRRERELNFGGAWNTATNQLDSTFDADLITPGTLTEVYSKWGESVVAIQDEFNGYVSSLLTSLPEGAANIMLDSLAAADFEKILEDASAGRWDEAALEDIFTTVIENYSEAMWDTLGAALGSGVQSFLSSNGAAGLVGSESVWAVLTDAVQQNITDAFTSAASHMQGGDVEGGIAQIQAVQTAVSAIASAMEPISEIIATNGLTDYEKSIRAINLQFDSYSDSLKAAGVDLAKYTALEEARAIAINNAGEALRDQQRDLEIQIMSLSGDAAGALAATREDELAALDESLKPLQERVWALEDEAKATAAAAAAAAAAAEEEQKLAEARRAIFDDIAAQYAGLVAPTTEEAGALMGLSTAESEKFSNFIDFLAASNEALDELAASGESASEEFAKITDLIADATGELSDELAKERLMLGDAAGALAAAMMKSDIAFDQFNDANGQFVAGAFNSAYLKEEAKAAAKLYLDASENYLSIPNAGSAIDQFGGKIYSAALDGFRDEYRSLAASIADGNLAIYSAFDRTLSTKAKSDASMSFPGGHGLADVYKAQAVASAETTQKSIPGFGMVTGIEAIAWAETMNALKQGLNSGRVSAEEYAKAVESLNEVFPDGASAVKLTAEQVAEIAESAARRVSKAGVDSLNYYFGEMSQMADELATATDTASQAIAAVTTNIGLMTSSAQAFGVSANAAGWRGGELTEKGQIVADAARIISEAMTTQQASEVAASLSESDAFAGVSSTKLRDLSLMLEGVTAYDSDALHNAFVRLSAALGEGVLTQQQYAAMVNESLDLYEDVAAKEAELGNNLQTVIDQFESIAESAKALADSLLISDQSTLSGSLKYEEAALQYRVALAGARDGDQEAMSDLSSITRTMLKIGESTFSDRIDYQRLFATSIADIRSVETVNDRRAQEAKDQLAAINSLKDEVSALREEIKAGDSAIASNTARTTRRLDEFATVGIKTVAA